MKYGESMVTAFALSQILSAVKVLENLDDIYDNERCSIWLHSLKYCAGFIAEELTRPNGDRTGSEMVRFVKGVIENLNSEVEEKEAVKLAALKSIEKLESFIKSEENRLLICGINDPQQKLNELKQVNKEMMAFLQKKDILQEYIEFVNEKRNK